MEVKSITSLPVVDSFGRVEGILHLHRHPWPGEGADLTFSIDLGPEQP